MRSRGLFFTSTYLGNDYVKGLQTPSNKVGFLLRVGYFRIVSRFFVPNRYHQSDVDFVSEKISVYVNDVNMNDYKGRTVRRHQDEILAYIGFSPFTKSSDEFLLQEAERLAHELRPQFRQHPQTKFNL